MRSSQAKLTACPNCGTRLTDAFCPRCGQEATPINPTVHDLLHDLTHEFLHVDARIFRSVRLLLTRPGFLSRERFAGHRAPYVTPIRLYLIFSVLFFAVSAFDGVSSGQVVRSPQDVIDAQSAPAGSFDAMTPERVRDVIDAARHTWVPRAMFLLLPVAALLVSLVTRQSGLNYPQHLYFAVHVHAAYFAISAVMALVTMVMDGRLARAALVVQLLYFAWYVPVAFRTAYEGSWPAALVRSVAVAAAGYALIVVATLVVVFTVALSTNASGH